MASFGSCVFYHYRKNNKNLTRLKQRSDSASYIKGSPNMAAIEETGRQSVTSNLFKTTSFKATELTSEPRAPDAYTEALSSRLPCATEDRAGVLRKVCILLCQVHVFPDRHPRCSELNKYVVPREWLCFFLPHTQFYAPEAFIKHTERLEEEFNFSG